MNGASPEAPAASKPARLPRKGPIMPRSLRIARPRSIFWRHFGVFAGAAVLPIAAMSFQAYRSARRAIIEDRVLLTRQLAASKRDAIQDLVRERVRRAAILAEVLAERWETAPWGAGREARSRLLEDLGREWIEFEAAAIFDPAGRLLAASRPKEAETLWDERTRAAARAALESGLPVPEPLRARAAGKAALRIVAPVRARGGEPIGLLAAELDLARAVASILERHEVDPAMRAYVLGTDGVPLSAVPGGEDAFRAILAEPPGTYAHAGCDACLSGSCHPGEYVAPDGERVVGACYASDDRTWMVVSESPVGQALASLGSFLAISAATSAAALGLLVGAGAVLGRRISAPIREVAAAARRIAAGDLSSRAAYGKDDEVGELVRAFNSLVDGLISSREEARARSAELEVALEQLARARDRVVQIEAMSAVGRLTASVVHEVRNPLSSVKMNLEVLSRPLAGDPRYAEHARIARDQIDRLERMLTDLLEYGRPFALRPERVSLRECAERAAGDVFARAAERGVEIAIAGGEGIELVADPARVTQAIVNLLGNAIDASPEGGRVAVACFETSDAGGRWAACEVRDRGPGIPREHRDRIFAPFFTTKEGGTGLGLATARKIAALHGGKIEFESAPGEGTAMRLVLPAAPEAGASARLASAGAPLERAVQGSPP